MDLPKVKRGAAIGLGALALSVPGLACGEKDEPDLSTVPQTETTPTATAPAPSPTVPTTPATPAP